MERIILFDGVCNFCNSSVQFILKRDPAGKFKFASLQSEVGKKILQKHGYSDSFNSIILLENGNVYTKSSAVMRICKHLKGFYKLLTIFQIIPPFIRDFLYDIIAKNRYRLFGKNDSCLLPSSEWKKRFL